MNLRDHSTFDVIAHSEASRDGLALSLNMCGICGHWDFRTGRTGVDRILNMRETMTHRGPDGAGAVLVDAGDPGASVRVLDSTANGQTYSLALAHRRLSIIDLCTGDQPMTNEDGQIWVVFNGEIYNYADLRAELKADGHKFRTKSDTEVILHAYEKWGFDCPARFNGIFAFAVWDNRKQVLFLARDHFGVKPLYYYANPDCFYFASEIKAILEAPEVDRQLDLDALNLCLTFRHTPSPWTLFKGIRKLSPGHWLSVQKSGIVEKAFWTEIDDIDRKTVQKEWISRLRSGLDEAVHRQMVSDVPIGLSLSSGVDSTTLLAIMSQHSTSRVKAFTVGFEGREHVSEIEPARRMAAQFGAEFHSQTITAADYAAFMDRYLWHLEEPIGNESAAAYYFVAEMARQAGVKVLLNGQGADEAFAGYGRYLAAAYGRWLRLGLLFPFSWLLPKLAGGTLLGERYHRFQFMLGGATQEERYLRLYSIMTDEMKQQLIRPDVISLINQDLPRQYIADQLAKTPRGTQLERMIQMDLRTSLPDNLLLCEDKMAMAASVEARVPFLDLDFMSLAQRIPGRLKIKGFHNKHIHRRACSQWVDREYARRPQIGFDNAVDLWLRSKLRDELTGAIQSSDSFVSRYLEPGYVQGLIHQHVAGVRDHQRILFLLLSLESWYRVFLRGK